MNVTNLTLNRIIAEFYALGSAHEMLKTRFYGDFLNIVQSNKVNYTSMLLNTTNGNIDPNFIDFSFEIAVMDKVFHDESNMQDVESETASILQDIFGVITYSNRWQSFSKVVSSAPIRKFIHRGKDVVTGWSMTLTLRVKRTNGICNVPIEDYDYGGDYSAYCAGVRIFEDGILIDVVASGGRFDFTGSGSSTAQITNTIDDPFIEFNTSENPKILPNEFMPFYIDGDLVATYEYPALTVPNPTLDF